MSERVGVGLVGGGMMGRELAATLGRWPALSDHPVTPELVAVCDTNSEALAWFERVASVRLRTADYRELLREDGIDVLYLAVPHHLHEQLYLDTIEAGRDFLGEKPFGIDLSRLSASSPRCASTRTYLRAARVKCRSSRAHSSCSERLPRARSASQSRRRRRFFTPVTWTAQSRSTGSVRRGSAERSA